MATFNHINGKLGNMRKSVEWLIYPRQENGNLNDIFIQSNKRIARINLETKKAVLSNGKGHPSFASLTFGTIVDVPQAMIDQINALSDKIPTGPVTILG